MNATKKYIGFLFAALFVFVTTVNAQDYKLPVYQKFTLKNGLTVYLMEQHEVPMINISVILPAGAIYDGDKAGLASLTATALKHGTKNYPKAKLDEELDFVGATVNTYASKESAGLSAQFAAKDKDKVLSIIYELLTAPVFDSAEFNKEKRSYWQGWTRRKKAHGQSLVLILTGSCMAIMFMVILLVEPQHPFQDWLPMIFKSFIPKIIFPTDPLLQLRVIFQVRK